MIKMNKKGMTVIEVLISFVLIMIILIALFSIVMNYREKANKEELREEYISFKAMVTKDIQNDILKKELLEVTPVEPASTCAPDVIQCVNLKFKDGTDKNLFVYNKQTVDAVRNKYIQYGDQKYKIRDDIPEDSEIPSGRTALDYQSVNVYVGRLFEKTVVDNHTIYGIHISLTYLEFGEDFGIHIVAMTDN